MITYSGIHIQNIGGEAGTPTPIDIAVHSGRICRFGGAVWYPLLPHLIFVGLMAYERSGKVENLIWGFLHDAHEVVTCDVPRPFKCDCMRREQNAIDQRILNEWFSLEFESAIDYDLIKKCDIDACDIEAVLLQVPNYTEVTVACSASYEAYRKVPHVDEKDTKLLQEVLRKFGHQTLNPTDAPVMRFAHVLTLAKDNKFEEVLVEIENWRFL